MNLIGVNLEPITTFKTESIVLPIPVKGDFSGITYIFKSYRMLYEDYKYRSKNDMIKIGEPYLFNYNNNLIKFIMFPNRMSSNGTANKSYILKGLRYLSTMINQWNIKSITIPMLSIPRGNIDFNEYMNLLHEIFNDYDITMELVFPGEQDFFLYTDTDVKLIESGD